MRMKLAYALTAWLATMVTPMQAVETNAATAPKREAAQQACVFCDSLLNLLMRYFPDSVKKAQLAVYPILNATGDKTLTGGTWVSEYLIRRLRTIARFEVVDRKVYRRALHDRDLGPRDVVDDSTAQQLSLTMKIPYMLTGAITPAPSGKYLLEGRIVDTQSGIIVTGATIEVSAIQLEELENMLISQRAQSAITPAMLRSMVVPGWGQFYRKRALSGVLFLTGFWGLASVDAYCLSQWIMAYLKDKDYRQYLDYSDEYKRDLADYARQQQKTIAQVESEFRDLKSEEGERLAKDALQKLTLTGAVSAVAACIYSFNLIDVGLAGRRIAHAYRLYFSGHFGREAGGMMISFDF